MTSSASTIKPVRIPFQAIRKMVTDRRSGQCAQVGFIDESIAGGTRFIQQGLGIGLRLTKIILGFLGVVGGAVAAAVFKENTAADWGSKILMIAGGVLGVLGVKDLMNFNKSLGTNIKPPECRVEVSESVGNACKTAIAELSKPALDPQFCKQYDSKDPNAIKKYNPNNLGAIKTNKKDEKGRKTAIELLKAYTADELIKHASTHKSGVEYTYMNIDSEPLSLAAYSDRLATLLGYVSASSDAADTEAKNLINGVLKDLQLGTTPYARVLPTDFTDTYSAAKWYFDNHHGNEDSVKKLLGGEEKIQLLEKCLGSSSNKEAKQYLDAIQEAQNYLSVLDKIICYVQNPDNLSDPSKARNVTILRQALICGLDLKGADCKEINHKLDLIHRGEVKADGSRVSGIQDKLKQINDFFRNEKVTKIINDYEKFPFERSSKSIDNKDPVLGGMIWSEFVDRNPSPVITT